MTITETSLAHFIELAKDASNWNGTPLWDGSKELRGNLTQLKQAGLVTTFTDEGCLWVEFTPAGIELAAEHSIAIN